MAVAVQSSILGRKRTVVSVGVVRMARSREIKASYAAGLAS